VHSNDTSLQSLVLRWLPCSQSQTSWERVQAVSYLSTCHITVTAFMSMMAICGWWTVASVADLTGNSVYLLLWWSSWDTSYRCHQYPSVQPSSRAIFKFVLRQDACNTLLGNIRYVQVTKRLSSVLAVLSWPVYSLSTETCSLYGKVVAHKHCDPKLLRRTLGWSPEAFP
jgi:hypothetical protein